jgi:D-aminopeptidase
VTAILARSHKAEFNPELHDQERPGANVTLAGQQMRPAGVATLGASIEVTGLCFLEDFGFIMTPIVVTNLRAVGRAHDAMVGYRFPRKLGPSVEFGWPPVVIGMNDSKLNDMRRVTFTEDEIVRAVADARDDTVVEGAVGAASGLVAFGFKSGVGSASQRIAVDQDVHTVGAITFLGLGTADRLPPAVVAATRAPISRTAGSIARQGSAVVILATDAPLDDRQCRRLAAAGLGGFTSLGVIPAADEGLVALAVSTSVRLVRYDQSAMQLPSPVATELVMGPLVAAALKASASAALRSLTSVSANDGTPEYPSITLD